MKQNEKQENFENGQLNTYEALSQFNIQQIVSISKQLKNG